MTTKNVPKLCHLSPGTCGGDCAKSLWLRIIALKLYYNLPETGHQRIKKTVPYRKIDKKKKRPRTIHSYWFCIQDFLLVKIVFLKWKKNPPTFSQMHFLLASQSKELQKAAIYVRIQHTNFLLTSWAIVRVSVSHGSIYCPPNPPPHFTETTFFQTL